MGFGKFLGKIAPFAGAGIGAMMGGPMGASMGGQMGNMFGGAMMGGGAGLAGLGAYKALNPHFGDPGAAAAPYYNQIPDIARQQYNPYIQQGNDAYSAMQPGYQQQATNPKDYINDIYDSYEPSKGYQFKKNELMKALGATAASGGYAGSQYDQQRRGDLINQLLSGDMQDWLRNVMGAQQAGRQGLEGAVGRGYESNNGLTDILTNALAQQGGIAASGVAGNNSLRQQNNANLMQLGGGMMGMGMDRQRQQNPMDWMNRNDMTNMPGASGWGF